MKAAEMDNYGNLTRPQLIDDSIRSGREEEAWARSMGFHSAHLYHQASDEAFDSAIASLNQPEHEFSELELDIAEAMRDPAEGDHG